jgi:hypothetical protein
LFGEKLSYEIDPFWWTDPEKLPEN